MKETNNKTWCVYIHTSPDNKVYIGITSQTPPEQRWGKNGIRYKRSPHFWNAIQYYGWDNFQHIIFADNLSKDEAGKMERCLILLYDTTNKDKGYNLTFGGEGGTPTEEIKQKLRKKALGRRLSQATREKIRRGNQGKKVSKETIEKLKEARKTYVVTDETRQKIKDNHADVSGGKHPRAKAVICIELNIVFDCTRDAERQLGINHAHISACCKKQRKTAGGYHWIYTSANEANITKEKKYGLH